MARSLGAPPHARSGSTRAASLRLRALSFAVALAAGAGLVAVPAASTAVAAGPVGAAAPGSLATVVTPAGPAAPATLEAAAGDRAVGLTWERSTSSGISGYSIYRSTTLPVSVTGTPINSTLATGQTYTDSSRTNGTTYHYAVVAVSSSGTRSPASPTASARPQAPAVPTGATIDWAQKASAAIGRREASGAALGGQLYVFGGQYTGVTQTARSDRYDPATDTWTRIADLPELITHAPVVADGTTLWILGGYVGLNDKDSSPRVWKYNTVTNTYTAGPSLPAPRGGGGAVLVGRQLHYFTGAVRMDSTNAPVTDHPEHWVLNVDGGTTWTPAAPVLNPRNHVGTALLNGKVYLVGGQHAEFESTAPQTQVDAYDVATGTWSRVADLPVPRGHISASTFVWNGKIVVLGGSVLGAQASRTFYEYDPATNAWTTRTNLPEALRSPVADLIDGRIVMNGGRTATETSPRTWVGSVQGTTTPPADTTPPAAPAGVSATANTEPSATVSWTAGTEADLAGYRVYRSTTTPVSTSGTPVSGAALLPKATVSFKDTGVNAGTTYHYAVVAVDTAGNASTAGTASAAVPAAPAPTDQGSWAAATSIPATMVDGGGAAIGTKVYVVGGKTSAGPRSELRIYDTATGAWSTGAPLPGSAVENPAVVAHNGALYAFGGSTAAFSGAVATAHRYDPVANTWTRLADMGTARGGAAAVVVGSTVWVVGGMDGTGASLASTERLDLATGTWTNGPAMATPRDNPGAAAVNGGVFVFGGRTRLASGTESAPNLSTTEFLASGAATWQSRAAMPTGRRAMAFGVLDGKVVAAGGERQSNNATWPQTEEYDPATNTWRSLAAMRTPRHGAASAVVDGRLHTVGGGTVGGASFSGIHEVFTPSGASTPPPGGDTTPPPAPEVSPADGTFTTAQSVTITAEAGAVIRYTVGTGSTVPTDPTTSSTQYSGPISVATSQVIKARAWDAAGNASPVTQRTYTIQAASGSTRTVTLDAAADTMARQMAPTTASGTTTPLFADSQETNGNTATRATSYLRFTVPELAAGESVSAARLSVQVTNSTTNGPQVWLTNPVWNESTLTWNTGRPARASVAAVGNFGSMGVGRVGTAVTGVTGAGDVSFELYADSSDGLDFASREHATTGNRPQLTLTIATGATTPSDTTAPAAPGSVTAVVEGSSIRVGWASNAGTDGVTRYRVHRSTSTPVAVGASTLVSEQAPVTGATQSFQDTGVTVGTTYHYVVVAVDDAGNASAPSSSVSAAVPASSSTGFAAKVRFQNALSTPPAGYLADWGQAYASRASANQGVGRTYGWVRAGTTTAVDLSKNGRVRTGTSTTDERLTGLMHMDWQSSAGTAGTAIRGSWEMAVPNGSYTVTVSVGDAGNFYNSSHQLSIEGVGAVTQFVNSSTQRFETATRTVSVTDGRLTLDPTGGVNTKINYVDIAAATDTSQPGPDTTAPAAPRAVATSVGGEPSVTVTWEESRETDVAGYRVYRSRSTPVALTDANRISGTSLLPHPAITSFTDDTVDPETTYYYVVVAVDTSNNVSAPSAMADAVIPPSSSTGFSAKVRFQDALSTPPAGYLADWGQAYASRASANQGVGKTYGWVRVGTTTPVDLSRNGRVRTGTATTDARLTGVMHMDWQSSAGTGGTAIPGSWEMAVPNGSYTVTVSVGDAGNFYNSTYQLSIEDQNAVGQTILSDEDRFRQVTRTVFVADGRLTLSPSGGTNTKINYVDVASVPDTPRPRIASVDPINLVSGVTTDRSVTAGLAVVGGGIDRASLSSSTVRLTVAGDGSSVAANVNTSGGGDVIVLTPDAPLVSGTTYRFDVTSGVKDVSGNAFHPWSSIFTVGTVSSGTGIPGVAFDKLATPATGSMFTSVTMGPDGRLYAATLDGYIFRYPVAADGALGAGTRIDTVRTHAGGARTIIGLAFDPASTATNLTLWITENRQYIGVADVPDWTGKIVRLTGANLERAQDVVVGLPRSARDHESNSLAFKDGMLYLTQGSNTAMGAPDSAWEMRPESMLSAAVLRLDPAKLPASLPLDVKTDDGGSYDPFAAGAPLTLYATGVRNAYDLVWHSNGNLYVPTNGSARGGNLPETPATLPPSCQRRIDGAWTGPKSPGVTANPVDETDWVFKVAQGGYYGHPNPERCEWAFNGGNPTSAADLFEATAYPVGTVPDRNYRIDDVFDAGMHASANGTIEYGSDVFGPALKGKLIVVRYSASQDLMVLDPSGTGGKIVSRVLGVTGFKGFTEPLDLAQHVPSGNIYVTELGGQRISRLVPRVG